MATSDETLPEFTLPPIANPPPGPPDPPSRVRLYVYGFQGAHRGYVDQLATIADLRAVLDALPAERQDELLTEYSLAYSRRAQAAESRVAELERERDEAQQWKAQALAALDEHAPISSECPSRLVHSIVDTYQRAVGKIRDERDDLKRRVGELERGRRELWERIAGLCSYSEEPCAYNFDVLCDVLAVEIDADHSQTEKDAETIDTLTRDRDSARASLAAAERVVEAARDMRGHCVAEDAELDGDGSDDDFWGTRETLNKFDAALSALDALPTTTSEELPGQALLDAAAQAVRAQCDALPPQPEQPAAPEPQPDPVTLAAALEAVADELTNGGPVCYTLDGYERPNPPALLRGPIEKLRVRAAKVRGGVEGGESG